MVRPNLGALDELSQDMERMFDSLLGKTFGSVLRAGDERHSPAVDVYETTEHYAAVMDLPGIRPEGVSVEFQDGVLVVSGTRDESIDASANVHRTERFNGAFRRSLTIPGEINVDQIDASFELGVLRVTLPKKAKQNPTKIQIRSQDK